MQTTQVKSQCPAPLQPVSTQRRTKYSTFKLKGSHLGRGRVGIKDTTLECGEDLKEVYSNVCKAMPDDCTVIVQNIHRVEAFGELFHAPVAVNGSVQLQGLLDSGSMACTISEVAEQRLLSENILTQQQETTQHIVLVGCGGVQVSPKCMYDMELGLHGIKCMVPVLWCQTSGCWSKGRNHCRHQPVEVRGLSDEK